MYRKQGKLNNKEGETALFSNHYSLYTMRQKTFYVMI